MYALLDASDFSDGSRTRSLAQRIHKNPVVAAHDLHNAFDRAVVAVSPASGRVLQCLRDGGISTIVCGSGPAVFALATPKQATKVLGDTSGLRPIACHSITREEALSMTEA
jgi:4-diphosphocytidyl-2C-methyl-D-erythritol kinase